MEWKNWRGVGVGTNINGDMPFMRHCHCGLVHYGYLYVHRYRTNVADVFLACVPLCPCALFAFMQHAGSAFSYRLQPAREVARCRLVF